MALDQFRRGEPKFRAGTCWTKTKPSRPQDSASTKPRTERGERISRLAAPKLTEVKKSAIHYRWYFT